MRTNQELFDIGIAGIRAQGFLARRGGGDCFYRMALPNGLGPKTRLSCVIGMSIADKDYDPNWDAEGGDGVSGRIIARVLGWSASPDFVDALQALHDGADGVDDLVAKAKTLGLVWKLDVSVCS